MNDQALVRHKAHLTVRYVQREWHLEQVFGFQGAAFERQHPGCESLFAKVLVLNPVQLRPEFLHLFASRHGSEYGVWEGRSLALRRGIPLIAGTRCSALKNGQEAIGDGQHEGVCGGGIGCPEPVILPGPRGLLGREEEGALGGEPALEDRTVGVLPVGLC